ncbi:MAG: YraN family protein [Chloroflexota bacterium]
MSRTGEAGRRAERAARDYLVSQGYTIKEMNFRTRFGEVDIIAEKDDCLVFVEVRARRAGGLVGAAESITARKLKRLVQAALEYRAGHLELSPQARFDFIGVELDGAGQPRRLEHIENALEVPPDLL